MQWPLLRKPFNLSRLADISDVEKATIKRWQIRECMPVVAVGSGFDREYTLSDALHVAVIAEMAAVGLTITGNGAMLSAGIVWHVERHFQENPNLDSLGPLALVPVRGEDDWEMEPRIDRVIGGTCIILGLRPIVEGVLRRYSVF